MSGKLHTVSVPLHVADGFTILDEEVGAEETLWLRWAFSAPSASAVARGR
jgi:hypothetical protein